MPILTVSLLAFQTKFNPAAAPFISQKRLQQQRWEQAIRTVDQNSQNIPFSRIGPTQLPVNSRIWESIAAVRPSKSMEEMNVRSVRFADFQNPKA